MTDRRGIQVIGPASETSSPVERKPGDRTRRRWVGWVAMSFAAVVLMALGGLQQDGDPPPSTDAVPAAVDIPPPISDLPVRITRGGLTSPALVFEEIARERDVVLVDANADRFIAIRAEPNGVHSIIESINGVDWSKLTDLPAGVSPIDLTTWNGEPLVLGVDVHAEIPASTFGPYGDPGLWLWANESWRHHPIEHPGLSPDVTWRPSQLFARDGRALVVGDSEPLIRRQIVEALPSEVASLLAIPAFWLEIHDRPPEVALSMYGSTVWETTLTDLGLGMSSDLGEDSYERFLLVSSDLDLWAPADLPDGFVDGLHDVGDGRIGLQVWGAGPAVFLSEDGLEWVEEESIPGSVQVLRWYGDGLVAALGRTLSRTDGERWRPVSPSDGFPPVGGSRDWHFTAIEVVDSQLVAMAAGVDWPDGREDDPIVLESLEGHEVAVDVGGGTITFEGESTRKWTLWQGESVGMRLDPDQSALLLLADGETIARLGFDSLRELDFQVPSLDVEVRVLLTRDEVRWHMGVFNPPVASPWEPSAMLAHEGNLLLVMPTIGGRTGVDSEGISVWRAPLP